MTQRICEVAVITQLGPKIYCKGSDFDHAEETRSCQPAGTTIALFKEGRLVTLLHPYVPLVIQYD